MHRYFVHFGLHKSSTNARIKQTALAAKAAIDSLNCPSQLAFTGSDGKSFAYLIESKLSANQIANIFIMGPKQSAMGSSSVVLNDDSLIVIKCDNDISGQNCSRLVSWFDGRLRQENTTATQSEPVRAHKPSQSQLASQLAAIKPKIDK